MNVHARDVGALPSRHPARPPSAHAVNPTWPPALDAADPAMLRTPGPEAYGEASVPNWHRDR